MLEEAPCFRNFVCLELFLAAHHTFLRAHFQTRHPVPAAPFSVLVLVKTTPVHFYARFSRPHFNNLIMCVCDLQTSHQCKSPYSEHKTKIGTFFFNYEYPNPLSSHPPQSPSPSPSHSTAPLFLARALRFVQIVAAERHSRCSNEIGPYTFLVCDICKHFTAHVSCIFLVLFTFFLAPYLNRIHNPPLCPLLGGRPLPRRAPALRPRLARVSALFCAAFCCKSAQTHNFIVRSAPTQSTWCASLT